MTFFTRVWDTNTPFIDLKMEDIKYHCSHFKLIGFLLSRTFLNIILSPSLKASWSSYLNPAVWLERAYWYSMITLLPSENRSVWFGELPVRCRQALANISKGQTQLLFSEELILVKGKWLGSHRPFKSFVIVVSEAQLLFNMQWLNFNNSLNERFSC